MTEQAHITPVNVLIPFSRYMKINDNIKKPKANNINVFALAIISPLNDVLHILWFSHYLIFLNFAFLGLSKC